MPVVFTVFVAYFIGSIPTGYLVARARGIDIRSLGSGNIGATNVFRTLGKGSGIFVLTVDGLKGYAGCMVWECFVLLQPNNGSTPHDLEWLRIVGSMGAILGHNYTCWLGFRGGKGIATSAGALVGLLPLPFLMTLTVWLVVFVVSRYVSLASIAAAAVLPFSTLLCGKSNLMTGIAAAMSMLAIYKHKANIRRLLDGTENRIGKSSEGLG